MEGYAPPPVSGCFSSHPDPPYRGWHPSPSLGGWEKPRQEALLVLKSEKPPIGGGGSQIAALFGTY